ncbi:MAG TPA: TMEM175 family protein [Micropepsaceae bacterium]|nr:TMEM175 family protein [Micropepsaceae bacterium]
MDRAERSENSQAPPGAKEKQFPFTKTRLEALSDGVFSVALTLLVVDLSTADHIAKINDNGWGMFWPMFVSFLYSSFVIAMYWVAHHNELNLIERPDRAFLWLNAAFLICIVFIPFSAAYLRQHWISFGDLTSRDFWRDLPFKFWRDLTPKFLWRPRVAVLIYASNLLLAGLLLQALWFYATRHLSKSVKRLLKHDVPLEMEIEAEHRNWFIPRASAIIIAISLVSPFAGQWGIVVVPLRYAVRTIQKGLEGGSWAGSREARRRSSLSRARPSAFPDD